MRTDKEIRARLAQQQECLAQLTARPEQTPMVIACRDITKFVIIELQWVLGEG